MQTLHLRVEDDFLDEFMEMLPTEKVKVVDQKFFEDQSLLEEALESYRHGDETFVTYYKNMEKMDDWLKARETK